MVRMKAIGQGLKGRISTTIFICVTSAALAVPQGGSPVDRFMQFDVKHEGKVTRVEVTDPRLVPVYDAIDTAKKGSITKAQVIAYFATQIQNSHRGPGGPGDFGGLGGRPGGPAGPGGFGGPPRPGTILPGFVADRLGLTAVQKQNLAALQKEVDAKLAAILTADQKKQLDGMRRGGPGGPGGPGGFSPGGPE